MNMGLYAYAANNPVRYTDRTGNAFEDNNPIERSNQRLLAGEITPEQHMQNMQAAGSLAPYAVGGGLAGAGVRLLGGLAVRAILQSKTLYNLTVAVQEIGAAELGIGGTATTGLTVASRNADDAVEIFYRAMPKEHYEILKETGKLVHKKGGETMISPTKDYVLTGTNAGTGYNGVLVQFQLKKGTTAALEAIGVRCGGSVTCKTYPNMPPVSSGWMPFNAFFKQEGDKKAPQINIGLGNGRALDVFNQGIVKFEEVSR